jgi:hypothetical protein
MSDEDRKVHARENEDPEESTEDVEAHVKGARANDEGDDGGEDVEAHVKGGR